MLVILLVILQYRLWFESGGILDMLRLKKQVALVEQQNEKIKQRNEKLLVQVKHLQKNPDEIEARARQDLGMVKKNETYYQVVK